MNHESILAGDEDVRGSGVCAAAEQDIGEPRQQRESGLHHGGGCTSVLRFGLIVPVRGSHRQNLVRVCLLGHGRVPTKVLSING